jgi:hypothetical protein
MSKREGSKRGMSKRGMSESCWQVITFEGSTGAAVTWTHAIPWITLQKTPSIHAEPTMSYDCTEGKERLALMMALVSKKTH